MYHVDYLVLLYGRMHGSIKINSIVTIYAIAINGIPHFGYHCCGSQPSYPKSFPEMIFVKVTVLTTLIATFHKGEGYIGITVT